ncbi:Uncharacterized protein QJS10_CPA08g01258 [Acorus calamus]|uniref:BZIP domain-containing protein n=1 Tax=Acorus calamus TaxID=4465 RepID=A0AAV9E879_ACOCL|nr:Uncharacterized protein QJS10_CPA08g01258 [Acorus calamus]
MANVKGATNYRNSSHPGKQSFLPPKSPFPCVSSNYADYGTVSNPPIGAKGIPRPREGNRCHQRTSSESFLIEEQPSWLDDLLNEPETPVKRGAHRRSSSDSFAYLDASNFSPNFESTVQDEYNNRILASVPSWGPQEPQASFFSEENSFGRAHIRGWESSLRDNNLRKSSGSLCGFGEPVDALQSAGIEKQDQGEHVPHDSKSLSERRDFSYAKHPQSETDPKRAKQQFAQRSRVRKLQYIAELERTVHALQAKGSEVSAELAFLDEQNIILNLENKTLKQRLDSLAQEQCLKFLQQEMLEREIARLRALYQQQQQLHLQQQPPPQQPRPNHTHTRSSSSDLDLQFANLSLKHNEAVSGRDPVNGALRI